MFNQKALSGCDPIFIQRSLGFCCGFVTRNVQVQNVKRDQIEKTVLILTSQRITVITFDRYSEKCVGKVEEQCERHNYSVPVLSNNGVKQTLTHELHSSGTHRVSIKTPEQSTNSETKPLTLRCNINGAKPKVLIMVSSTAVHRTKNLVHPAP